MATYQEQIAEREASRATKALVACAELGSIGDALSILVREQIIDHETRIAILKKYVMQHPEINERIEQHRRERNAALGQQHKGENDVR